MAKKSNPLYQGNMDQEESEIGRFKPKGNPNEPREPFIPHEEPKIDQPSISSLKLPESPLDGKKLKAFLIQLEPIIENIQEISRDDQHMLASYLHQIKDQLHASDLKEEVIRIFDELVVHYNDLLTHSSPEDQKKALEKIRELLK